MQYVEIIIKASKERSERIDALREALERIAMRQEKKGATRWLLVVEDPFLNKGRFLIQCLLLKHPEQLDSDTLKEVKAVLLFVPLNSKDGAIDDESLSDYWSTWCTSRAEELYDVLSWPPTQP